MKIKNRIREYRTKADIDQQTLAEALGVTRTYLSKLENQKLIPGPGLMLRVCEYFRVGLGDMFFIQK